MTDVEGSTRHARLLADDWPAVLVRHHLLLREAFATAGGRVVNTSGDGALATFASAAEAVIGCVEAQRRLGIEPWPTGTTVRVRMGVHVGRVVEVDGELVGLAIHQAARVAAAGSGGQLLLSGEAARALGEPPPLGLSLIRLGRFRLKDFEQPIALIRVDADCLEVVATDPRAPSAVEGRLPVPRTTLVGRELDLAAIGAAVEASALVTLVGPGGVGKTRLAVEAARHAAPRFGEVVFVDLARVTDPRLVPDLCAGALGLRLEASDPLEALTSGLQGRSCLVVADNCEHVIDAAAEAVAAMLEAGHDVHVLATSREPLSLTVESLRRVEPLDLPVPGATREVAAASPAVRLLLDRLGPRDRPVSDRDLQTAAMIARRVDGLPLAIEFAAGRARSSGVRALENLGDQLRTLRAGRGFPARQQTLAATLDWSHSLLTDEQRAAFRRLAVFRGGFTLDLVATVIDCEPDLATELVLELVDRSLVSSIEAVGRYRFLESVGAYAEERLEEAGEVDETLDRHLAVMVDVATRLGDTTSDPAVLDLLAAEHANFQQALEHALTKEDTVALELAEALSSYWTIRGHLREGAGWLRRSLKLPGGSDHARAGCLVAAAQLAMMAALDDEAQQLANEALELAPTAPVCMRARIIIGSVVSRYDPAQARDLADAVRDEARATGDTVAEMKALQALGAAAQRLEETEQMVDFTGAALSLARQLGDRSSAATLLSNLAAGLSDLGRPDESLVALAEATNLRTELGDTRGLAITLLNRSEVELRLGQNVDALHSALTAARTLIAVGEARPVPAACINAAGALLRLGRESDAARLLAALAPEIDRLPAAHQREFHDICASLGDGPSGLLDQAWTEGTHMTVGEVIERIDITGD
jgi:predicted ATPase